jgi:pimeloyl-ACP methyl ester carboxylesterase
MVATFVSDWAPHFPVLYLSIHMVVMLWLASQGREPVLPLEGARCPATAKVTTVFAAGLGGDINQLARYTGFNGGNGYWVYHPDAALLLHNPWLGENSAAGSDVQPHGVSRDLPWWFPTTFVSLCITVWTGVRNPLPTLHDFGAYTVGQEADVRKALTMVRAAMAAHADLQHRFVLFGTSRGAAVMLQVAARLTPGEAARVGLLVLEGVFDTIPNVLEARYGRFLGAVAAWLLEKVTSCKPHSEVTPLAVAKTFPHRTMPVLVVASAADWHVPLKLGKRVYAALVDEAQVNDATFLALAESHHARMSCDKAADRAAYARTLEALYAKYLIV